MRDSTSTRAEGDAKAVRQIGVATAEAYSAQADVVGSDRLAILKVLEEVSTGQVKITPDVMVSSGGDGDSGGGLFNAWLATPLAPTLDHQNGLPIAPSSNGPESDPEPEAEDDLQPDVDEVGDENDDAPQAPA